jgi:hypothetical protein
MSNSTVLKYRHQMLVHMNSETVLQQLQRLKQRLPLLPRMCLAHTAMACDAEHGRVSIGYRVTYRLPASTVPPNTSAHLPDVQ